MELIESSQKVLNGQRMACPVHCEVAEREMNMLQNLLTLYGRNFWPADPTRRIKVGRLEFFLKGPKNLLSPELGLAPQS